ncbi:hypothetical protein [Streptomyces sp. MUM 178J]|uniref:hypothetical protein n=1 Tax=Streptomyces sp. MUM 178J TaxID=2791991 RepID=UPI001F04BCA7|nr:hypothetical protein [Streptomyces sp. MUM 178J]WRQ81873.1 hypothetical protein I3F59_022315 [Streptomyces sp. MUM 178J]
MPASEREAQRTQAPSSTPSPSGVPMSDLLASCAAANAVSTPPRAGRRPAEPADEGAEEDERRTAA